MPQVGAGATPKCQSRPPTPNSTQGLLGRAQIELFQDRRANIPLFLLGLPKGHGRGFRVLTRPLPQGSDWDGVLRLSQHVFGIPEPGLGKRD